VYKNPKKSTNAKPKGASAMQPAASAPDGTGVKLMKGEVSGQAGAPVYEEKFWKKRVEDVPVDQVCLLIYWM
jgi:ribosome biogenesis protein MAK21